MNKDPQRLIDRNTNNFPNRKAEWENQRKLHHNLHQVVHSESGDHSMIIGNEVPFNPNARKEVSQKMNKDPWKMFDRNTNHFPNGQAEWENLGGQHPNLHQALQPESGDHSIIIPERMINAQVENLRSWALIDKIVDFVPDWNFICQWVGKNWEGVSVSFSIDNGDGFFMVLFENNESRDRIHRKKDWFIAGRGLITQIWYPNFISSQSFCSFVPVWISFSSPPLEYRDTETLEVVGNSLGIFIRLDLLVFEDYSNSTRICILKDTKKKWPSQIRIKSKFGTLFQKMAFKNPNQVEARQNKLGHLVSDAPIDKENSEGNGSKQHGT
ncbi:hypothetical protein SUGI_0812950 [Cryptomeria japonica]|nr:hypothetical protein SUGI_0812950 [Cryptomeria japonica]